MSQVGSTAATAYQSVTLNYNNTDYTILFGSSSISGDYIYYDGSDWVRDTSVDLTFNNANSLCSCATTVSDSNGLQYAVYCAATEVYAAHFEDGKLVEEKIEGITSTATSDTNKAMQTLTVDN